MVFEEFMAFVSLEKGALFTTYKLSTNPGKTIRSYLDGERKRLTNPMRYLAMSTALVTLAYVMFMPRTDFGDEFEQGMKFGGETDVSAALGEPDNEELAQKASTSTTLLAEIEQETESPFLRSKARIAREAMEETLSQRVGDVSLTWMNVLLLAALPINAVLTWLVFRKAKLNFAEHFATNAFILGLQNILAIIMLFPSLIGGMALFTAIYMVMSFTYQYIAWRNTFRFKGVFGHCFGFIILLVSAFAYLSMQGIVTVFLMRIAME